jgi:general secretion pathway protein M
MNPREKLTIAAGVAALAVLLLVYGCILPLMELRARTMRQTIAKENELQEMRAYRDEYDQLKAENLHTAAILKQRPANFSLFSFLDQLAGSTGIKSKIIYMKPSTVTDTEKRSSRSRVEIKLNEVNLEQISRLLYQIETSPHLISVPRLSIKQKQQASGLLETVLQVETLEA